MFRIGLGTDTHRLEADRPLWVGGIEIPSAVGAVAHSDGDVLLHALTDALLGAIGGGDIGELFPDTDERWKDQASHVFAEEAARRVVLAGYRVENVDATIQLETVKLSPHKPAIEARICEILVSCGAAPSGAAVNVKAKTAEQCDAIGEGRAIGAQVAVLLSRVPSVDANADGSSSD
jgi:2-C-methyl-D-erythritol 2,4-cyclodiphosphate synthase